MSIPEKILQLIAPGADPKRKLMIAKGAFPLPPNVQVQALGQLLDDQDIDVRKNAQKTIMDIPSTILGPLIEKIENPKTLHVLAIGKTNDDVIMEYIMLSKFCSPQTIEKIAIDGNEKLCTMIMNNQVRLLKYPKIADVVKNNPHALQSEIEKMSSFLRMNGIVLEGESTELTLEEIENILAMPDDDIPKDLLIEKEVPPSEDQKKGIYQILQDLNVAQKIKLALKGNKEVRSILIKDGNKLVASAVVKNPRITDNEVLNMCQNRSIQEEILRIICLNPQWVRHYTVQVALANNPKTPFQHALRFAKILNVNDLKRLSKNKNASAQLQKMAKVLFQKKKS